MVLDWVRETFRVVVERMEYERIVHFSWLALDLLNG